MKFVDKHYFQNFILKKSDDNHITQHIRHVVLSSRFGPVTHFLGSCHLLKKKKTIITELKTVRERLLAFV